MLLLLDVTYFVHRAVRPDLARQHHAALLQHYHRAHLEAVKSFGMHGFEMELETLLNEYQDKQDYGAMMGCREALCSTDSYLLSVVKSIIGNFATFPVACSFMLALVSTKCPFPNPI